MLDHVDAISISSHAVHLRSPVQLSTVALKAPNPSMPTPCEAPSFDIAGEERMLQDIVDEVLAQGVRIICAYHLCRQELVEARLSIRLTATCGVVSQGVRAHGRCRMR